jgi:hypothetical protein
MVAVIGPSQRSTLLVALLAAVVVLIVLPAREAGGRSSS